MTVKDVPEEGNCYQCNKTLDSDCFGWKVFICQEEDCGGNIAWSLANSMGYGHQPEDHFVEAAISEVDEDAAEW